MFGPSVFEKKEHHPLGQRNYFKRLRVRYRSIRWTSRFQI